MKMIRAIVRPEKSSLILNELMDAGYPAVTKIDVVGRGKQRGIKVGNIHYDELQKEMLMMVVEDEDKDEVVKIIAKNARTGDSGAYGDGKIFVSTVEEVYTISSGQNKL
ncbi:nitrogen fixation protein NifHD [Clostridium thermosuccinogenes]|uniref:Nitrogen fixation protein NifHD n=1 Tax=Clostridium thermosuccinogenes TaxID=84032 RepID=A0A2K2FB71_9CLOT|nr:P-II family nitrogen regulator [Pseudoclostridium thermosuccinogenes]AUS95879.1 nitrogen fixation protein NifHD [Pseudoclostridium thermosuccinogenes]PNT93404.1 nitrogen fixation protein NifHD [Pseudoclostridium thermosuccinogenes]PNT95172.1 nitrogen fixation protein NifHD [Pseudoclostridium thermosuccinogenes]PNT96026.1 nitrogen fixation protein NifHD [Pseudoclostridium thermosuccinogenes]